MSVQKWRRFPFVAGSVVFFTWVLGCAESPLGRKQLLLIPNSQMNEMGTQAFEQMKGQTPRQNDPELNRFVQCVTQPLIAAMKPEESDIRAWEVVVFQDASANAFALPGGKIGVHDGLLSVTQNADQLAAVVGHEIGHVIARHGAERVSQGVATQGGLTLIQAFIQGKLGDSPKGEWIMAGLGLGAQVGVLLPYGRTQESESDLIGQNLMARAGFDPEQSIELWKNMKQAAGGKRPPEFLSTHPAEETRMDQLQSHLPEARQLFQSAKTAGRNPQCGPVPSVKKRASSSSPNSTT